MDVPGGFVIFNPLPTKVPVITPTTFILLVFNEFIVATPTVFKSKSLSVKF
jgi:hypothetical protein